MMIHQQILGQPITTGSKPVILMGVQTIQATIRAIERSSAPTGVAASDGTYTDKVTVAWNASTGATYYQVFRNTTNSHSGEIQLVGDPSTAPLMTSQPSPVLTIITG